MCRVPSGPFVIVLAVAFAVVAATSAPRAQNGDSRGAGVSLARTQAPSRIFDLPTATIADINAAIDSGAMTSERLVQMYLDRIAAYDQKGPRINSIITINPKALDTARALDEERRTKGRRSLLHGIPVVVKDLLNTSDMPTTGGFIGLKGAIPAADAHVIARLHEAGAIIFAKANMSDWLGRGGPDGGSSVAGPVLNPYDPTRTVSPSSSGTSAAIAAWFGTTGVGTETGTSIRNPSTDGSLMGLSPTEGLIGRSGAMANTFTHERIGPMCRTTYDLAVMLDQMVGFDVNDLTTSQSLTHLPSSSYTAFLNPDGLRGARLGVLREMFRKGPAHAEGLAMAESAIFALHKAGASVYDPVLLGMNLDRVRLLKVNYWEAETILNKYLAGFGPRAPFRTIREMIEKFPDQAHQSFSEYLTYRPGLDPEYQARLKGRRSLRSAVVALLDRFELDAVVFPYKTVTARPRGGRPANGSGGAPAERSVNPPNDLNSIVRAGDRVSESDNYLSSMTGLPGLVVPMGYTTEGIPLSLEFLGRPFSEPTLIRLASGFEAATKHRVPPKHVPALAGEKFAY